MEKTVNRIRAKFRNSRQLEKLFVCTYHGRSEGYLEFDRITKNCGLSHDFRLQKLEKATSLQDTCLYYQIEYNDSERWRRNLFPLLREWCRQVNKINIRDGRNFPLFCVPPEALTHGIRSMEDLQLSVVEFGSFPDRRNFISHWEISFFTGERIGNSPLIVEFMHDESCLIVRYSDVEYERGRRNIAEYSLKICYRNVSRIVVSLEGDQPVLFFDSRVPVEIRRKCGGLNGEGVRVTSVCRGRIPREVPAEGLLADCQVLALRFVQVSDIEIFDILSRIVERSSTTEVQVASFITDERIMYCKKSCYGERNNNMFPNVTLRRLPQYEDPSRFLEMRTYADPESPFFGVAYLIEALFARGATVKDQILCSYDAFSEFKGVIEKEFEKDAERCEWALEDILGKVIESPETVPIVRTFRRLVETPMDVDVRTRRREVGAGYVRCRKVIVTPTRILPLPPETIMGCRVLRIEGTERSLRVSFREDDGSLMRRSTTSPLLLQRTVDRVLTAGIRLCGVLFEWLGNSNSQYREHGAFLVAGNNNMPMLSIRQKYGNFNNLESDQKTMARFGQCFTQSKGVDLNLYERNYETTFELVGGRDGRGRPFCFSDGVGAISEATMEKIVKLMKYPDWFRPSCVQFRFRGMKGVLGTDVNLDGNLHFLQSLRLVNDNYVSTLLRDPKMLRPNHLLFRPSQIKFHANHTSEIEVVKMSTPTIANLNRPFLAILDQVSCLQSKSCHERIVSRVEELLDEHIDQTLSVLLDEQAARDRLKDMPYRFDVEKLQRMLGFNLTIEPFFRSILMSTVKFAFTRELTKMQIHLPANKARMMFGVVDETGLLQSGQVFVKFTKNIANKFPRTHSAATVLSCQVKVTKHPCISAGDVRDYQAVDIPELHHLRDVIVFPRHGPRPHPDEMAGSDLDGDEYVVIWDDMLLYDYNMPAMDYTPPTKVCESAGRSSRRYEEVLRAEADCYTNFMLNDCVGTMAIAHLVNADRYGITHPICDKIARLHMKAVDFPKSGETPERLENKRTTEIHPVTRRKIDLPPTKPLYVPDFLMKDHGPAYRSNRLVGKIFRQVDSLIERVEEFDQPSAVEVDGSLNIEGWAYYERTALEQYDRFTEQMQHLMEQFGVRSEAELFSGAFLDFRNSNAQKEKDDMSSFTTSDAIKLKLDEIWCHFREEFCWEFSDSGDSALVDLTELSEKHSEVGDNILYRVFTSATSDMKRKAVAYYRVCYERASDREYLGTAFLSFGWLMWDILVLVKKGRVLEDFSEELARSLEKSPLEQRIGNSMATCKVLNIRVPAARSMHWKWLLYRYWKRNLGLQRMLSLADQWAVASNSLSHEFRREHVLFLLIAFVTGQLPGSVPVCERIENTGQWIPDLPSGSSTSTSSSFRFQNHARLFLKFLEFLASSAFRNLPALDFSSWLGVNSYICEKQWEPLSKAARDSLLCLALSGTTDCLEPTSESPLADDPILTRVFTIHIPSLRKVTCKDPLTGCQITRDEKYLDIVRAVVLENYNLDQCELRKRTANDKFLTVRVFVRGTRSGVRRLMDARLLDFGDDDDISAQAEFRAVVQMTQRLLIPNIQRDV